MQLASSLIASVTAEGSVFPAAQLSNDANFSLNGFFGLLDSILSTAPESTGSHPAANENSDLESDTDANETDSKDNSKDDASKLNLLTVPVEIQMPVPRFNVAPISFSLGPAYSSRQQIDSLQSGTSLNDPTPVPRAVAPAIASALSIPQVSIDQIFAVPPVPALPLAVNHPLAATSPSPAPEVAVRPVPAVLAFTATLAPLESVRPLPVVPDSDATSGGLSVDCRPVVIKADPAPATTTDQIGQEWPPVQPAVLQSHHELRNASLPITSAPVSVAAQPDAAPSLPVATLDVAPQRPPRVPERTSTVQDARRLTDLQQTPIPQVSASAAATNSNPQLPRTAPGSSDAASPGPDNPAAKADQVDSVTDSRKKQTSDAWKDTPVSQAPATHTPSEPTTSVAPAYPVAPAWANNSKAETTTTDTSAAKVQSKLEINPPVSPQPTREISLKISDPEMPKVDIKLIERAGQVHVTVRAESHEAAQSLRSDLSELVGSLARKGYATETWSPGTSAAASTRNPTSSHDSGTGPDWGQGGQQQRHQGWHGRSRSQDAVRDFEQFTIEGNFDDDQLH